MRRLVVHGATLGCGWMVVAHPEAELLAEAEDAHQTALAYVRHALGARVMQDGPSFPHPMSFADPSSPARSRAASSPEEVSPWAVALAFALAILGEEAVAGGVIGLRSSAQEHRTELAKEPRARQGARVPAC